MNLQNGGFKKKELQAFKDEWNKICSEINKKTTKEWRENCFLVPLGYKEK